MATRRWITTSNTNFNTAANWSGGSVPVSSDTIIFDGTGTADLALNLDQSALTGITLIITHANQCKIGTDTAGVATYFQVGASSCQFGRSDGGTGTGSPQVLLDFGSTTNATSVLATASTSTNTKYPPVCLKGTGITLTISGGTAGVAVRPGETSTVAAVKTTAGLNGSSPSVYLGSGVTATLITIDAGDVLSQSNNTTVTARVAGGRYYASGTGAHTTLHVDAGTCYYTGTGTITTANVRGSLTFANDARARTVTDATIYRGGSLDVDNGVPGAVTFTNPIQYPDGLGAITIKTPAGVKGSLTNI